MTMSHSSHTYHFPVHIGVRNRVITCPVQLPLYLKDTTEQINHASGSQQQDRTKELYVLRSDYTGGHTRLPFSKQP